MKLGLIGNPLGHSWSAEIHKQLIGEKYSLWQLEREELGPFFDAADFDGINVTIPYKQDVMSYLDDIDPDAEKIGAVNCVVNSGGSLKGYNTDLYGLSYLLDHHCIDTMGGTVAILGTGGASKMAAWACRQRNWECVTVSRTPDSGSIGYQQLYDRAGSISLLINATPVGMYPDSDRMPIDIKKLPALKYVVDIVANPVRTELMLEAEDLGIEAYGGLEMLVAQAFRADELFTGRSLDAELISQCVNYLRGGMINIVLTGMPSAGKTSIARLLSKELGRKTVDADDEIVSRIGMPIAEFFVKNGEGAFREIEAEVIKELALMRGVIISTGGGVVKRKDNMHRLARSGMIIWLDRDPSALLVTDDRPLSSSSEAIMKMYEERRPLYEKYCDIRVTNNSDIADAVREIKSKL